MASVGVVSRVENLPTMYSPSSSRAKCAVAYMSLVYKRFFRFSRSLVLMLETVKPLITDDYYTSAEGVVTISFVLSSVSEGGYKACSWKQSLVRSKKDVGCLNASATARMNSMRWWSGTWGRAAKSMAVSGRSMPCVTGGRSTTRPHPEIEGSISGCLRPRATAHAVGSTLTLASPRLAVVLSYAPAVECASARVAEFAFTALEKAVEFAAATVLEPGAARDGSFLSSGRRLTPPVAQKRWSTRLAPTSKSAFARLSVSGHMRKGPTWRQSPNRH